MVIVLSRRLVLSMFAAGVTGAHGFQCTWDGHIDAVAGLIEHLVDQGRDRQGLPAFTTVDLLGHSYGAFVHARVGMIDYSARGCLGDVWGMCEDV
jgi:hypothetical protein